MRKTWEMLKNEWKSSGSVIRGGRVCERGVGVGISDRWSRESQLSSVDDGS